MILHTLLAFIVFVGALLAALRLSRRVSAFIRSLFGE